MAFSSVNDACPQVEKSIKTVEVNLNNLTDQVNDLSTKIVKANQELSDEVVNSGQTYLYQNGIGPTCHSNLSMTFSI